MAELHVQRKRSSLSWFWILLILILIAGGVYFYLHYKNPQGNAVQTKSSGSIKQVNKSTAKTIQA
jgi:flagellar basal body-associated protein FliL